MNPIRKRKLGFLLFFIVVITTVTLLIAYALRQNISLFYSPEQVVKTAVPYQKKIRLGGMVVKGSIVRGKNDLSVQFQLTDFKETISVRYTGILPDLFREGQGIVATGVMTDATHFKATEILAKHDANYMPPEVKASLAKNRQKEGGAG